MDQLLTAADIAAMLRVPKTWVYEQARKGLIPTVELGRYRRFRRAAVEEWIAKQERNGAEEG